MLLKKKKKCIFRNMLHTFLYNSITFRVGTTDFGFFKIMIFAMYFKIGMFLREKNLNYNGAKLCKRCLLDV